MTRNFASLQLARLYEKQGYINDALEIYRQIDTSLPGDVKNIDILDTISRLEAQKKTAENSKQQGPDALKSNQVRTKEAGMAQLLEVWLKLIVMQKRVDIFKSIKARL
ncbi:hypothetical protein [uncultured Desulfobacter sp.]|uniref:hypothetical protein n=1 Tax=uncultured Desulfobacter sp. TaxID=240139 RepID=UPI002AAAE455|nr:hypothetical protein [uncultured Desulfobacter sp.]